MALQNLDVAQDLKVKKRSTSPRRVEIRGTKVLDSVSALNLLSEGSPIARTLELCSGKDFRDHIRE